MAALLPTAPAGAQGNIDAGRSPAQIFADTCASCHRSARELRRPSASFLRQHYTAGAEEASAMASYLSGLPAEPKGAQPKRPPAAVGDQPAEAKQQPKQQPKGKQQAKQQPATETPAEQPAATQHTVTQPAATQPAAPQAQAKGRRGATAEVRPAAPAPAAAEERPAAPTPAPPTPPAPALEPFEE